MIALGKLPRSADAPSTIPARSEWTLTESELRARRHMEDAFNQRAERAKRRRFTGESITGFGALA